VAAEPASTGHRHGVGLCSTRTTSASFTFANAVRLWGEVNPDFFKGTVVEREAAEVLAKTAVPA
jgi:hypothetical protein